MFRSDQAAAARHPFSTPSSPSGEADIVADVGEERPLVLETKLFDPDRGDDRGYLRQDFRQAHDYAVDYGQAVGYLVVFNCTPMQLVFRTGSDLKRWPPRIEFDGRTFFIVTINLASPAEPASKRGALKPYVVEAAELTSPSPGKVGP